MVPTPTDRGLDYECMLVAVGDGGRRIVLAAWMVICIGVMILIELIPGRDVIGGRLADIKLAYGSVGICAFMAMLGALRVMVRASRSAA